MAIAFDAASSASSQAGVSSLTASHTCTGSNLVLCVGVSVSDDFTCSGVTYNSVAMTQGIAASKLNSRTQYLFYLANPATGAHNIVASFSGSSTFAMIGGISLTGANTASPLGGTNDVETASATSLSANVTVGTANSMVVDVFKTGSGAPTATGTNQNVQVSVTDFLNWRMSTILTTTTGTYSPAYSWSGAVSTQIAAMEIKAAVAVAGLATKKLLMGVGL